MNWANILHVIVPGLAGAVGSYYILRWLYSSTASEKPARVAGANVFTYGAKTRRFMTGLGAACMLFAALPAVMIPYKYFGPEPCGHSPKPCRNKPMEDAIAGTLLFLGFGLGGVVCLVDPRKYYAKLDAQGITVRGLFSGVQHSIWQHLKATDCPSLQMVRLNGRDENGKPVRMWVPYLISGFGRFVARLNEQGIFFEQQLAVTKDITAYLHANGYPQVAPYRLYFPLLAVWREPGTEQFVAVLPGIGPDGETHHIISGFAVTPEYALVQLKEKFLASRGTLDEHFFDDALESIGQIIEEIKET